MLPWLLFVLSQAPELPVAPEEPVTAEALPEPAPVPEEPAPPVPGEPEPPVLPARPAHVPVVLVPDVPLVPDVVFDAGVHDVSVSADAIARGTRTPAMTIGFLRM